MTVLILNILLSFQPLDLSLLRFPSLSVTSPVFSFFPHRSCCYWDVAFISQTRLECEGTTGQTIMAIASVPSQKQSSLSFLSTSAGERTWEVSKKSQTNSTDLGYFLKTSQAKKVQLLKAVRHNQ